MTDRERAIEAFLYPYGRALMLLMGVTDVVRPKKATVH
jgi:hypothetical protein